MQTANKRIEVEDCLNEKYGYLEDRDIRFHETNENAWVDLSYLPRCENGKNKGKINWLIFIGYNIPFKYKDVNGEFVIADYERKR